MSNKKNVKLKIKSVSQTGNYTLLNLEGRNKLRFRPYIYVRPGDIVEFIPNLESFKEVYKIITEKDTGEIKKIKLHPPYYKKETVCISPHKFQVVFRERLNCKDWQGAMELEQFHYRGKGFNKIVGRRTVLIAECKNYGVIGFGIVSASLAAAGPRFKLLNTNFTKQMKSGLINRIVRIPRIVIHPEFRGIGLGVLMAKHLINYVKSYWDINHYSPIMIEVIAAMTEYHKFFEKAGFLKIGYTNGYGKAIIPRYGNGSFELRDYSNYDFMQNQKSKPYLVFPLNNSIKNRIKKIYSTSYSIVPIPKKPILNKTIILDDISVTYKTKNGITKRSLKIRDVFGVNLEQAFPTVIRNFFLEINPGDVILITGASGSGKSTIIKLLTSTSSELRRIMTITGKISRISYKNIAVLNTKWSKASPLIEQVKKDTEIKEAIELLNSIGLCEAYLYIKHPNQISDGQKYRFAIAKLCDSKRAIWIADEFASTLNPEMAAIVAKGLRKVAVKYGATVILSAAHIDNFVSSLLPNKLIRLKWGGQAILYSLKAEYNSTNNTVLLNIRNTCKFPLNQIKIGIVNSVGKVLMISHCARINPREKVTFQIRRQLLRSAVAIIINCAEKIGDIIYLAKTSR